MQMTRQTLANLTVILAAASLLSAEPLRGSQRFHRFTDPQLGSMPVSASEATANPYPNGVGTQDIRARMTLEDVACMAEDLEGREPSEMCRLRRAAPRAVQPYRPAKPSNNLRGSQRYHQEDERRLGIPESAPGSVVATPSPADTTEIRGTLFEDTRVIHRDMIITLDNGSRVPLSAIQKTLDNLSTLLTNAPGTFEKLITECRKPNHALKAQDLAILKGLELADRDSNISSDTCSIATSAVNGNGPPLREFPSQPSSTR